MVSAADFLPTGREVTLGQLRQAANACRGCDLYQGATQAVFGEGPTDAELFFIAEAPGDQEDRTGRPFTGASRTIFESALETARIDRARIYLTNAVKHFRFELARGRRLYIRPTITQVRACKPWLEAQIMIIHPKVLVLMGATAGQAILGSSFRVHDSRGRELGTPYGIPAVATLHPMAVARMPEEIERERSFEQLSRDFQLASGLSQGHRRQGPQLELFG